MKWHGVNRVGISWHITGIFIIEFWFLALSVGDLVKSATYPIHAQWLLNLVSMKVNWVPANLLLLYHFYIFIGTSIRMNVKYNFSIPIFYCNIFLKVIFFFFFLLHTYHSIFGHGTCELHHHISKPLSADITALLTRDWRWRIWWDNMVSIFYGWMLMFSGTDKV